MSILGEVFTAEQALHEGLVDRIAPKGQALVMARDLAKMICTRSKFATSSAKMMINAADGEDGERAMETLAGIAAAHSAELKAGLAAFRAKKK